jgi:AAA15 family ATPase/GTPase
MLTRIRVRGFKSIDSVGAPPLEGGSRGESHAGSGSTMSADSLELGQVNVFIGANGAGKSNLLEAIGLWCGGPRRADALTTKRCSGGACARVSQPSTRRP